MTSYILDALITLCLTQSLNAAHCPVITAAPRPVRSVWGDYKRQLYTLQPLDGYYTGREDRRGFKLVPTWHENRIDRKPIDLNKGDNDVSR